MRHHRDRQPAPARHGLPGSALLIGRWPATIIGRPVREGSIPGAGRSAPPPPASAEATARQRRNSGARKPEPERRGCAIRTGRARRDREFGDFQLPAVVGHRHRAVVGVRSASAALSGQLQERPRILEDEARYAVRQHRVPSSATSQKKAAAEAHPAQAPTAPATLSRLVSLPATGSPEHHGDAACRAPRTPPLRARHL